MNINCLLELLADQLSQAEPTINSWKELRLLVSFIQNRSYTEVFFDFQLSETGLSDLTAFVERRCQGEPISKIIGKKEFWSLPFKVTRDTLDPRPDSETLIQAVLDHFPDRAAALKMIDFGTGTGCLLLSTLSEYPQAWGIGIDQSLAALRVAQENAQSLGLSQQAFFLNSDWATAMQGKSDIIISNPPYIRLDERLDRAVKQYDPPQALYGGEDGFEAYTALLPQIKNLMHKNSLAFIEIGQGQGNTVRQIGAEYSLVSYKNYSDLAGIERVLVFKKS